jgi:hypothetical protein
MLPPEVGQTWEVAKSYVSSGYRAKSFCLRVSIASIPISTDMSLLGSCLFGMLIATRPDPKHSLLRIEQEFQVDILCIPPRLCYR